MAPPKQTKYGTWQVRYRDPSGRQRGKNFRTKALAEKFQRETLTDLERGDYWDRNAGKVALRDWCETWLAGAHNLAPKSLILYRQALAHILPVLGNKRLDAITAEDIDAYITDRLAAGAAPSSVHREYRTLRRALRLAVQRDRLRRSPVDHVKEPDVPDTEMRFLTAAELERFAAATDKRYRSLILVAGWGGLRWGELAGLRTKDVDLIGHRVHVVAQLDPYGRQLPTPKTKRSRRWVTLPESVLDALRENVRGRTGYVWTAARGGPLIHSNFLGCLEVRRGKTVLRRARGYFRPALVAAKLDPAVTPHDLRHTACALAIKAGAHPKALQARMGHSSIQVTLDRYGHLYPEMDAELAVSLDGMRADALRGHLRGRMNM